MISKPSNPFQYFVTGNKQKEFRKAKFGSRPFYIAVQTSGYIPVSILVFAYSETDALDTFTDGLKFRVACAREYCKHSNPDREHHEEFTSNHKHRVEECLNIIAQIGRGTLAMNSHPDNKWDIQVNEASTDQMYKVGWGDNDGIMN